MKCALKCDDFRLVLLYLDRKSIELAVYTTLCNSGERDWKKLLLEFDGARGRGGP